MDQVYIPKRRAGLSVGSYVVVRPLETRTEEEIKPFFHNVNYLEPIKVEIINEILKTISQLVKCDNIIVTGSFLDRGFKFNDIDVIVITEEKINITHIINLLENKIGPKFHLILISNKALIRGYSTDPLFMLMLDRCVSKKRFIYKENPEINYKLLDLHLLKSKPPIDNFDFLTGNEKYEMTRNLIAISQFIDKKEVTNETVHSTINNIFGNETVQKLKNNLLSKKDFLDKYKELYNSTQNKIFKGIKDDSKQK